MSDGPDAAADTDPAAALDTNPGSGSSAESAGHSTATGPLARARLGLAELDTLPLAEHPEVYQRLHSDLQGALATIDDA